MLMIMLFVFELIGAGKKKIHVDDGDGPMEGHISLPVLLS